jgi:hypothetical protein
MLRFMCGTISTTSKGDCGFFMSKAQFDRGWI